MGEPAQRDPVSLARALLDRASESVRHLLEPRLEQIVAAARAHPPERGAESEFVAVADFTQFLIDVVLALDVDLAVVLRTEVSDQADTAVLEEYKSTDLERKLAYRHLSQTLEVLSRLFAAYAAVGDLLDEARESIFATAVQTGRDERQNDEVDLNAILKDNPELYASNALVFAVTVALEARDGNASEFASWAKRALESAREVDGLLPRLVRQIDAVAVRHRAEHAWQRWDESEIASELREWKKLVE